MESKMTKLEKYWILYDVGNSAFVLLVSTILPIYFNYLAGKGGVSEVDALAFWGYGVSISTILVALIGPVLGTIADTKGYKKPIFTASVMVGVAGCAALALPGSWLAFLAIFVVARVGYASSLIFYDAMLSDVTEISRMDRVSSQGYAWGYIGSCVPFILSLVLVLGNEAIGITIETAMAGAFLLNAAWWFLVTIPLLRNYRQSHGVPKKDHVVRESFVRLARVLKDIKGNKKIFLFLLSFFFYIDGVYTIIEMATAYGSAIGLDTQGLLLALLVTQIVAFPCALIFGKLAGKYKNTALIKVCVACYFCIALFAIQLDRQWEFWLLAVCVGMFQGGIQALSRSYFASIIPPEKSGEFFGIFDICGKGASFVGTALVGVMTQVTRNPGSGVGMLAVLFAAGFILFGIAARE
ncbi:MAG: MFS transporter [Hungatella sp.]|jgi:UMF1 family MFS transporter|nr:MFS transporter [Hungatella sp.]MCI9635520.1 MFS transporter [Hungatella sp.]